MLYLLVIVAVAIYCFYYVNYFTFWSKLKVKQAPLWTAIKENFQITTKTLSVVDHLKQRYDLSENSSRYVGLYILGRPVLLLRDPELVRQLVVKDRDQFLNRLVLAVNGNDPFWDSTLFALHGERWHTVRTTASPAFTTNKMKTIFLLLDQITRDFVNHLLKTGNEQEVYKTKDIFRQTSADAIVTCSFGQRLSLDDFFDNVKRLGNYHEVWKSFQICISRISKTATKLFNFKEYDSTASKFFLHMVQTKLKAQGDKIIRPNLLELLADSNQDNSFTDEEITALAMTFFLAGSDTSAVALCFTCYEMALHPEIQQRLRDEINETLQECDGKLTYDAVIKMKYLDMVVSESLRKWPPALYIDRISSEKYTIEKSPLHSDEPDNLVLDKNTSVFIPIYMIQNNPEYFPEPEVFNPERFSDENKKNIKPYSYIPFGVGPRSCVGLRFALMQIKLVICHMLHHYEIVPCAKTQIPVKLAPGLFNLESTDGILLNFIKCH